MSWETTVHIGLVERLVTEVTARYSHLYSLTVLVDLPSAGRNRPMRIGGYIPDVFALDVPETIRIIGEAKTPMDCETPHSRAQLAAFLAHLSCFPTATFLLAVPLFYKVRASQLLEEIQLEVNAATVNCAVLGEL